MKILLFHKDKVELFNRPLVTKMLHFKNSEIEFLKLERK